MRRSPSHPWSSAFYSLAICVVLVDGAGPALAADPVPFQVPVGQRQLFLDDHGIDRISALKRTMHRPAKRGAVIRSPDPKQTVQTRTAPVWDPLAKRYKLWVIGIDQNLWESQDGLHWGPGGQTNTRIMMAVYDPRDADPTRRFKAPLLNQGFAVSSDGVQWNQLKLAKIPSSDEGNFSFDAHDGLFIHTVKRGGTYGRSLALATSRDFVTWDDLGIVFQSDARDQELGRTRIDARFDDATLHAPPYRDPSVYNVDVYNMGVFRYESIYIGIPALYHATGPVPNYPNTVGFHLLQLACSRDLKQWRRLGQREPWIGPSRLDSGAYDLTQILPPSAPLVQADELWFYYTGLKWRGSFTYVGTFPDGQYVPIPGRDRDAGAICLAVLRRDGFVSLDAVAQDGVLDTRPFPLRRGRLHVNVDARQGELRVDVLDASGRVVAVSEVVRGDQPRVELAWETGSLDDLVGQTVQLRFTLRRGSLYSYWLAP